MRAAVDRAQAWVDEDIV